MAIQTERYDKNLNTALPPTKGSGQPSQERPTEAMSEAMTASIKATSDLPGPITVFSAGT